MVDREDIGSWLQGPPRPKNAPRYPGEGLGLPEEGPGSMAPTGRRVVALFIDGVIAQVIAMGLLGYVQGAGGLGGYTVGHRLLRLRVDRCPSGYAGLGRGLVRSVLLCLALPPLIVDREGRGLHDRLAGTVIVRSR